MYLVKLLQLFLTHFYKRYEYSSKKNGKIIVSKNFGELDILSHGISQSSTYLSLMWKVIFNKHVTVPYVRNVLILGLAGGNLLPIIKKKYPKAHIDAVEWDEIMVNIYNRFFKKKISCKIFVENAFDYLKRCNTIYDIIIIDIFTGGHVDSNAEKDLFIVNLKKLLSRHGVILFNAYDRPEIIKLYLEEFIILKKITYKLNIMYILHHKNFNDGFIPFLTNKEYLVNESSNMLLKQREGYSMEWYIGRLRVVKYIGNTPPDIIKKGLTLAIWQPIDNSINKTWGLIPIKKNNITGYTFIDNKFENYFTKQTQRYLKKYFDKSYYIEEVSSEEFLYWYKIISKNKNAYKLFESVIPKKIIRHKKNVHLILIKMNKTATVLGGFAYLDIPSIKTSMMITSYVKKNEDYTAGIGMVYYWFKYCLENKLVYADFDTFYAKGDPKQWIGFSNFKANFGTRMVIYKPIQIKFIYN